MECISSLQEWLFARTENAAEYCRQTQEGTPRGSRGIKRERSRSKTTTVEVSPHLLVDETPLEPVRWSCITACVSAARARSTQAVKRPVVSCKRLLGRAGIRLRNRTQEAGPSDSLVREVMAAVFLTVTSVAILQSYDDISPLAPRVYVAVSLGDLL